MNKMKSNRNLFSLIQFVAFIIVQVSPVVIPAQVMMMEMLSKEIEIQKNYIKKKEENMKKKK